MNFELKKFNPFKKKAASEKLTTNRSIEQVNFKDSESTLKLPIDISASTLLKEDESYPIGGVAEREKRFQEVLDILSGKKLKKELEKYKLLNFLGDGTYGFVLAGICKRHGEVAIKFVFRHKVNTKNWVHDKNLGFVSNEIHFLSKLHHPNIIKYIEHFETQDYIIIITEMFGCEWKPGSKHFQPNGINEGIKLVDDKNIFKPGSSDEHTLTSLDWNSKSKLKPRVSCDLFECVDAHEYLPDRTIRKIFSQLASAILYLQMNNIVHRDLKDENIVVDEFYRIRLIDFGSASFIPDDPKQYFDRFLGTVDFASPEILKGCQYRGPEAEMWALGVILYVLFSRNIPFRNLRESERANFDVLPRMNSSIRYLHRRSSSSATNAGAKSV
eukprot:NODE_23_length_42016_cov_0.755803.p13 type:complete len:385 gc:universal NODE_23_length_42016_cov_0.755803:27082-28236(+)